MSQFTDVHEFARQLAGFVEDENRAALAALRRGIGRPIGEVNDPMRYLGRWFSNGDWRRENAFYLVASLFATHQISWESDVQSRTSTNLGASFDHLATKVEGERQGGREGVERRFVPLLNAHVDDLPVHLRHAVSLLRSKEIPIDWARLVLDVENWDRESRLVQRSWARAFWGVAHDDSPPGNTTSPPVVTDNIPPVQA